MRRELDPLFTAQNLDAPLRRDEGEDGEANGRTVRRNPSPDSSSYPERSESNVDSLDDLRLGSAHDGNARRSDPGTDQRKKNRSCEGLDLDSPERIETQIDDLQTQAVTLRVFTSLKVAQTHEGPHETVNRADI